MKSVRILVLHGPNLNLLGSREPGIYGSSSLAEIDKRLSEVGKEINASVECAQSNHEGDLVERIQGAKGRFDIIVLNAAAFTHTSIAIRDAILAAGVPVVEVHLSNLYKREPFRQKSTIADLAHGIIMGFGVLSYELGLRAAVEIVRRGSGV